MAKFPNPPSVETLKAIPPQLVTMAVGQQVSRIFSGGGLYRTTWDAFRYFGPTDSRFDHHLLDSNGNSYLQGRGIMYLATGDKAAPTCLAEVFQSRRIVDRHSNLPIYAGFALATDVSLLDLSGHFVTTIGASTAIHSGPRLRSRRWARALYETYPEIDGILYCSSMFGNAPAIALFERARKAIPHNCLFHRELRDSAMDKIVYMTAHFINYGVV